MAGHGVAPASFYDIWRVVADVAPPRCSTLQLMLHEPEPGQWQTDDDILNKDPRMLSCEKLVVIRNLAISCKMIFQAYQESLGQLVPTRRCEETLHIPGSWASCEITQLCIGDETYGYIYDRLDENTWQGRRGSDWAADGEKLVLKRSESGEHWTDFDVANHVDAETSGVPVFRTSENPIEEGNHIWQANWNRNRSSPEWRAMGGRFVTTILA